MRFLSCFPVALWACALPAQLQNARPPSIPAVSRPETTGALPAVGLPRATGYCTPEHNHCVRPATWFMIDTKPSPGTASPATPVYEKDGGWLAYRDGYNASGGYVLRTEVASAAKVKFHDVLLVWHPQDSEPLWPESEDAAQTDIARWVVTVVETVDAKAGTFTIKARPDYPYSLAAARSVVEMKEARKRAK